MSEESNGKARRFVSFSLPEKEAREIGRVARRYAYPRLEPFVVELVRVGLAALEERYEPVVSAKQLERNARRRAAWPRPITRAPLPKA